MIDIDLTMDGDKKILDKLRRLAKDYPEAAKQGLVRSIREIYDESFKLLRGPSRKPGRKREWTATGYRLSGRLRGQADPLNARPGSYPVPVITGHLRSRLAVLEPGERIRAGRSFTYQFGGRRVQKIEEGASIQAGPHEVILYDSAVYAETIHKTRPFMKDAFTNYGFGRIRQNIEDELRSLLNER